MPEMPGSPLADALRGRDYTVLLGAGASVEAGVPTAPYLAAELAGRVEQRSTPWNEHEAKALNFVIAQMRAHAASMGESGLIGPDVEELFSAVQMLTDREHVEVAPFVRAWHPAIDSFASEDRIDLTRVVLDSLERSAFDPVGKAVRSLIRGGSSPYTYRRLLVRLQACLCEILRLKPEAFAYLKPLLRLPGRAVIATLNYDLGVENAAAALKMQLDVGVETWTGGVDWSWSGNTTTRLLKLHGSIDWQRQQDRDTFDLQPLRVGVTSEVIDDPLIIFGRREKLRAEGPFLAMLAEFERSLAKSSALLVVGYSFRDEHINVVLKRWLIADQDRRLAVIDPSFPESYHEFGWSGGPYPLIASLAWLAEPPTDPRHGGPAATQVWVDRRTASAALQDLEAELV
jgi:hypothetical protein